MGDARAVAGNGHAAWPESFNEMLMQVAGAVSVSLRAVAGWAVVPGGRLVRCLLPRPVPAVPRSPGFIPGGWKITED